MTKTQSRTSLNKEKKEIVEKVRAYNATVYAHNKEFKDTRKKLDLVNA